MSFQWHSMGHYRNSIAGRKSYGIAENLMVIKYSKSIHELSEKSLCDNKHNLSLKVNFLLWNACDDASV